MTKYNLSYFKEQGKRGGKIGGKKKFRNKSAKFKSDYYSLISRKFSGESLKEEMRKLGHNIDTLIFIIIAVIYS